MNGALDCVLEFYRKLPFNITDTPETTAKLIAKQNSVTSIYPFENDLYYADEILELGCGAGWLSNSLAYYYPVKVVGVDFNEVAIVAAQKAADILFGEDSNVSFVCDDLFKFDSSPKDIVISNGVLHHTSNTGGV